MKNKFKYLDMILSFCVAFALTFLMGNIINAPPSQMPQLDPAAKNQDVYIIGNSMFGTGLDLQTLRDSFTKKTIDFSYYNGYYTSMWNLAISVGMKQSNAPKTIVWGFRPTFAIYPSLRQNKDTKEQAFAAYMPDQHKQVLAKSGDPAFANVKIKAGRAVETEVAVNQNAEPFEVLGEKLVTLITRPFKALNGQADLLNDFRDQTSNGFLKAVLAMGGPESLIENGEYTKTSDLLIRYVTDGKIQTADALVVDDREKFVSGDIMPFEDSFIPRISKGINALKSQQIVVIFRPVSTFKKPLPAATQKFYEQAVSFFKSNNIAVIDLMVDPALELKMYAKGDHLNADGQSLITNRIVEKLKQLEN